MITPIYGTLIESGNHLVFGHSPQMLTTGVIRMLYPRNMKHICNKLRCDYNVRTSNMSRKERYWKIETMHVGIKLLDQHGRISDQDVTQWLPSPTVNDSGKVSVGKVPQMTQCSEWRPRLEKFFEKSFRASSSQNRIWEGVGSEEDDVLECKGFWDRADLRLGAIDTTNVNRRRGGRKRQSEKLQTVQI